MHLRTRRFCRLPNGLLDCSVMPFLRILCPVKKKSFATSVETSVQHKASLPNIIKFSYCPYCYTLHGWTPDEAFFDEAYETSEWMPETRGSLAGKPPLQ